jgi:hypothetical protein
LKHTYLTWSRHRLYETTLLSYPFCDDLLQAIENCSKAEILKNLDLINDISDVVGNFFLSVQYLKLLIEEYKSTEWLLYI